MCTITQIGKSTNLLEKFPKGKCLICKEKTENTICQKCAQIHLKEKGSAIAICANCESDKKIEPELVRKIDKTLLEVSPNTNAITLLGNNGDNLKHIYIVGACTACDPEGKFTRVAFEDLVPSEGNE